MKPSFVPHHSYQTSVLQQLQSYDGSGLVMINKDWPLRTKLWMTDLSSITTLLHDVYSDRGPQPQDPASMLRSFLVFLMIHPDKGLTEWVNVMKRTPMYAIASGFDCNRIPGVETFYDFFKRLWPAVDNNLKSKFQRRKFKPPKGKKKGKKAPIATPGRIKRLVHWMIRHANSKTSLPTDRLFHFFQTHLLAVSAQLGLLGDVNGLSVTGDGIPIVTAAYPRNTSTCDCHAQGLAKCNHVRLYTQPDCDSGWDSAREKYSTDTTCTCSLQQIVHTMCLYTQNYSLLPGTMPSVLS
ncbi:hypothetical protein [Sulfoacidibacillus ferrooxidans]|uniref:Transposase InsH N-terminal domain-containing protein n=1 Tax=Sulfoacidibacillus ferrooxidans TaxID=2005001 RepID=A0A9X1VA30_9BACL|nr:hypothetical protein [Sulfoacidibacillus ferrooxidans]MCI0184476.1 hypothetical protein [Sulfoacidibacillus ferrooxidans]